MSIEADQFKQVTTLYESTIRLVTDPQDYFSSDEYYSLKHLAYLVFEKVRMKCAIFLGIARGSNKGQDIGLPGIERALCFPARFLKEQSTTTPPDTTRVAIDDIIENTFFLGLMCHLFLNKFPTRGNVEQVNMDTLVRTWGPKALVADMTLKTYGRELNDLPLRVFESYFTSVKPILKKRLKLGLWKAGKCHSYFRNLFFSGALLGMHFDLMTK
ncbi:hypothetical protein ACFLVU_02580 [Chloroflexota bacterium]